VRIGIDLGGTKTELIAVDAGGELRHRARVATPAHDYDAIIASVVQLVQSAEAALRARASASARRVRSRPRAG